uniref:SAM domain-containing protein n=1 Tax=Parastrongyloides trichosuri TaxID=131310 RepID=A0A0N4ZHZ3_PARTI
MGNKNSRSQLPPNAKFVQNSQFINAPGMYYFKPGMAPILRSNNSPMSPIKVSALHQSMHCLANPDQIPYIENNKMASRLSLNELGTNKHLIGGMTPNPIPFTANGKVPPGYFVVQGPPMDVKSYKKWQKAHKKIIKKMSASGDTIIPYPQGPVMPMMMPGMIPLQEINKKQQGRATSLDNLAHVNGDMYEQVPRSGCLNDKKKVVNKQKLYRKSFHYEERSHNATSSIDYNGGTSRVSSSQSNPHTGTLSDYRNRNDYDGEDTSSGIVCTSESSENHSTSNQHDNGRKMIGREIKSSRSSNSEHNRTEEDTSLNASFDHPPPPTIVQKGNINNNHGVREIPIQRLNHHMYSEMPKNGFNTQSSISSINFNLSNINHKDNRTSTPYKSKTFLAPTPPQQTTDNCNEFNETTSDSLYDGSTSRPSISSSSKGLLNNSRIILPNRNINPSLQTINSTTNYSHPRSEVSDIDFSWVKDIENRLDKEISAVNKSFMNTTLNDFIGGDKQINCQRDNKIIKNEKFIPVKYFGMEDNIIKTVNTNNNTKDVDYSVNVSQKSPNNEELSAIHSNVKSKAAMFDYEACRNEIMAKEERENTKYLLRSKQKSPPSYEEHKAKHVNKVNMPFIPKPDYLHTIDNNDKIESYYSKILPPQNKEIKKMDNHQTKYIRYQQNPNRLPTSNNFNRHSQHITSNIDKIEENAQHPWRTSLAFSS